MQRRRQRLVAATVTTACAVVVLASAQFVALVRHVQAMPAAEVVRGLAGVPALLESQAPQVERTVDAYAGYGTWVDVYDFVPAMQASGGVPSLTDDAVDEMAAAGVRTLYLQAAQLDERSPGLLVDRVRVAQMLVRAHQAGLQVVGWYLPRLGDLDRDLAHLQAIADFEVLGHRFDGVAVDIEWTESVPDHAERSTKLVELSERLRAGVGSDALGAVVLPPVQLEVINVNKWPDFPWRELEPLYDAWLPMGYWTVRTPESGYQDGYVYTEENARRLRDNLGDDAAPVHVIGGIGDGVTAQQATDFAQAIEETGAIGGSIYDWETLDASLHEELADHIEDASDGD